MDVAVLVDVAFYVDNLGDDEDGEDGKPVEGPQGGLGLGSVGEASHRGLLAEFTEDAPQRVEQAFAHPVALNVSSLMAVFYMFDFRLMKRLATTTE